MAVVVTAAVVVAALTSLSTHASRRFTSGMELHHFAQTSHGVYVEDGSSTPMFMSLKYPFEFCFVEISYDLILQFNVDKKSMFFFIFHRNDRR